MTFRAVCLAVGIGLAWAASVGTAGAADDVYNSDFHSKQGLQCFGCHGEWKPTSEAYGDGCLMCHVGYADVAQRTKALEHNPHDNHFVKASEPDCTDCHQTHQPDKNLCVECHIELKDLGKK